MDEKDWFKLTVRARDVEYEERRRDIERPRPPMAVAINERLLRWCYDRIEALEQTLASMMQAKAGAKEPKAPKAPADQPPLA